MLAIFVAGSHFVIYRVASPSMSGDWCGDMLARYCFSYFKYRMRDSTCTIMHGKRYLCNALDK